MTTPPTPATAIPVITPQTRFLSRMEIIPPVREEDLVRTIENLTRLIEALHAQAQAQGILGEQERTQAVMSQGITVDIGTFALILRDLTVLRKRMKGPALDPTLLNFPALPSSEG